MKFVGLRRLTCSLFGHERELASPAPLETVMTCRRCDLQRHYRFEVESGFWKRYGFPSPEKNSD